MCTQLVNAVVVEVRRESNHSMDHTRRISWHPVYEYVVGGETIRKRSGIGGMESDFHQGERLTLMINPDNVQEFYNPKDQTGMLTKIFLGVGLVLVLMGVTIGMIGKKMLG